MDTLCQHKANKHVISVDGQWGDWSNWSSCDVTCGGGKMSRTRKCDNPACAHGGKDCTWNGTKGMDVKPCNAVSCPIDGAWGDWGEWEACSVTCGGGKHSRRRTCDSPPPEFGGLNCTWNGSKPLDIEPCNTKHCPSTIFVHCI